MTAWEPHAWQGCASQRRSHLARASPSNIAHDDKFVYWTNAVQDGAIMRVSKAGGAPEIVAPSVNPPGGARGRPQRDLLVRDDQAAARYGVWTRAGLKTAAHQSPLPRDRGRR